MGLKAVNVFLLIGLSAVILQSVSAKPRDSTVVEEQRVVAIDDRGLIPKDYTTPKSGSTPQQEVKIPGRVSCDYDEATEVQVCQEHCLPKGYSYGICVSYTCSCV